MILNTNYGSQGLTMAIGELQSFHTCEIFNLPLFITMFINGKMQHTLLGKKILCYIVNFLASRLSKEGPGKKAKKASSVQNYNAKS